MDNQFKVGDILGGSLGSPYAYTGPASKVRVVSIRTGVIDVEIIVGSPNAGEVGECYPVEPRYFQLLKPKRKIQEWV